MNQSTQLYQISLIKVQKAQLNSEETRIITMQLQCGKKKKEKKKYKEFFTSSLSSALHELQGSGGNAEMTLCWVSVCAGSSLGRNGKPGADGLAPTVG